MKTSERIPTEAAIKDEPGESKMPPRKGGRMAKRGGKRRGRKGGRY